MTKSELWPAQRGARVALREARINSWVFGFEPRRMPIHLRRPRAGACDRPPPRIDRPRLRPWYERSAPRRPHGPVDRWYRRFFYRAGIWRRRN
jgi:hypothetical protein